MTPLQQQTNFATTGGVTDMDDEGAGQLSSTNLHRLMAAAVEGHDKHQLAYHA